MPYSTSILLSRTKYFADSRSFVTKYFGTSQEIFPAVLRHPLNIFPSSSVLLTAGSRHCSRLPELTRTSTGIHLVASPTGWTSTPTSVTASSLTTPRSRPFDRWVIQSSTPSATASYPVSTTRDLALDPTSGCLSSSLPTTPPLSSSLLTTPLPLPAPLDSGFIMLNLPSPVDDILI